MQRNSAFFIYSKNYSTWYCVCFPWGSAKYDLGLLDCLYFLPSSLSRMVSWSLQLIFTLQKPSLPHRWSWMSTVVWTALLQPHTVLRQPVHSHMCSPLLSQLCWHAWRRLSYTFLSIQLSVLETRHASRHLLNQIPNLRGAEKPLSPQRPIYIISV